MPKTYIAGDQLAAAEYNQIVKIAGLYAAASGGSDTYAFTVSPVPTTYATGDEYSVLFDVASDGSASANFNSLGAKTIVRPDGTSLQPGDIVAGMHARLRYDGTYFRIISTPPSLPKMIQRLGLYTGNLTHELSSLTSEADGSVIYVIEGSTVGAAAYLMRYAMDPVTGVYYKTHEISCTVTNTIPSPLCLAVCGSYVYAIWKDSGAIYVKRYNKADLTSETGITISGTQPTTPSAAYSDGTDLYINSSGTTWYRYTISGTTITNAATVTSHNAPTGAVYDQFTGKVYMVKSGVIYRYTAAGTLEVTGSITYNFKNTGANDASHGQGLAIADSTKLFLPHMIDEYTDLAKDSRIAVIVPVGKPV